MAFRFSDGFGGFTLAELFKTREMVAGEKPTFLAKFRMFTGGPFCFMNVPSDIYTV